MIGAARMRRVAVRWQERAASKYEAARHWRELGNRVEFALASKDAAYCSHQAREEIFALIDHNYGENRENWIVEGRANG